MGSLLAIVLVFGGLITFHELGHFLVAKRLGVQVDEFAVGFGPRLLASRRGETEYTLRLFPLGGFVKMAGMFPETEAGGRPRVVAAGRGFNDKGIAARMAIIFAGPFANFFLAVLLFVLIFSILGIPTHPTLEVLSVQEGSPADRAGIERGDRIVAIDGVPVREWRDLQGTVQRSPNRPLTFTVERNGVERPVVVTPRETAEGTGLVGISPVMRPERLPFGRAIVQGVGWTFALVAGWFEALAQLLTAGGGGQLQLLGPVGIGQEIGQASQLGPFYLLSLAAVISAHLGLVNLLPIPALDGSRLVFLVLEAIRGRPVDPEKENFIHFVGFALLMLLALVITYRDILRLGLD